MRAIRTRLALLVAVFFAGVGCHQVHFVPKGGAGAINIDDNLFSVSTPDGKLVLAAGYWGSIYRSDDAGQSWERANTGTKRLVYGVSMADTQAGWAVGQLGLVLRTEDGGKTWARQSTPKDHQGVHLFAVQALSPTRAIAVGEWGTIIVTNDGGKSWRDDSLTITEDHPQFVWLSIFDQERVREGKKVFEDVGLNDVHCLRTNPQHCWIIGEFAYLFHSEDGGEHWKRGEIDSGIKLAPIPFGYNKITLPPGAAEKITAFAKEIADQQHLNVAIEPRVSAREIRNFGKAKDPTPLFEIIEARTQEVQSVVEDAGILTDRIRRRGAPPWDYEDFLQDDPQFLNRYLKSRLADKPGVEVEIAQNPYLFTVRFANENEGYISGLGGVVLRSHDGGRHWVYEDIGQKMAVFSVYPFPFNPERAVLVGEKGLFRVTGDGGASWKEQGGFPTLFTFMRDVSFDISGKVGYIVGQRGMILRTEDAGATWHQVLPPEVKVAQTR